MSRSGFISTLLPFSLWRTPRLIKTFCVPVSGAVAKRGQRTKKANNKRTPRTSKVHDLFTHSGAMTSRNLWWLKPQNPADSMSSHSSSFCGAEIISQPIGSFIKIMEPHKRVPYKTFNLIKSFLIHRFFFYNFLTLKVLYLRCLKKGHGIKTER